MIIRNKKKVYLFKAKKKMKKKIFQKLYPKNEQKSFLAVSNVSVTFGFVPKFDFSDEHPNIDCIFSIKVLLILPLFQLEYTIQIYH